MKSKHTVILLFLIMLCLAVRLYNFVGIGTNDDVYYIQNAQILASGNSPYTCQIGFRSGMVAPLALAYKIFGLNEKAFAAYPLICSLITCALIYLTAVRLWGTPAAIFASLLWIAYPLQIVFDTQLSPSDQHATCVAASLFFYSLVAKPVSSSKWGSLVFLMLSGVFLGFAWLVNEIFVTFVLIILPFVIIVRPKIRHLLWITAGFALVFCSELLFIKITTGSWFTRFACILNTEQVITSNNDPWYLPRTLFKVLGANPLYEEGHFGIIWYLFIIISVSTLFLKDKLPLSLALGCWLWLAYIQWGGHLLLGEPIAKYIRYVSMTVPLQCLVFGAVLGKLLKFSKKLKPAVIFLFILLLIHLSWLGTKAVNSVKLHTKDFKEIAKYFLKLDLKSDDIIYTDFITGDFIEIYGKGKLTVLKANIQGSNIFTNMPEPQKGILIKDGSRAAVELTEFRSTMPKWYLSPPEYWQLLTTIKGQNSDVYETFDPQIYRILPQNMKGDQK
jgi:hypothetical protein